MTIIHKNNLNNEFKIESIDPKTISEIDLKKIAEIEQDMWAREDGIWEYIKCTSCGEIHSKEEVFWHLSNDIKILTVAKIEEILKITDIPCISCNSKTEFIYDRNEYIEEIRDRYNNSIESFLTVYRDPKWEIRGFFDWYLDTFDNIYDKEFDYYYSSIWKKWLKEIIEFNTQIQLPENILLCSALWMEESYKNFFALHDIIKEFFLNIFILKWGNVFGIAESTLGSNTHSIYHSAWAIKTWILSKQNSINNKKEWIVSDIFIHPWITNSYINKFWNSPRDFLKKYWNKMKEVLVAA